MRGGRSEHLTIDRELEVSPGPLLVRHGRTLAQYDQLLRNRNLTRSERQVALLVAGGLHLDDIAEVLHVTRDTVKTHHRGAGRKLGAKPRHIFSSILRDNLRTQGTPDLGIHPKG
jgi:DNA-binding CsgD family transcriptional regulator